MSANDAPPAPGLPRAAAADLAGDRSLRDRVSRSIVWNALLLPLITVLNATFSILIRRGFGLDSAVYDILLGILNTLLFYTSLGIPTSLTKFVPEREVTGGRRAVESFLGRALVVRLSLLLLALVPLNLFAAEIAQEMRLGESGVLYLRVLSALVIGRALLEFLTHILYALLAQLPVNMLSLAQAALEPGFIALVLVGELGMTGVLTALVVAAAILIVAASFLVVRALGRLAAEARAPGRAAAGGAWRFAVFTYLYELSLYFGGPDFARTALGATLERRDEVALFSVAYYVTFMALVTVISAFRGVYRPMFARLLLEGSEDALRRAFSAVCKVQTVLLLPAGVGLAILMGDYVPLLYGEEFSAAVPVGRLLVVLLFTETLFNLGIILLSTDERYRAVAWTQALLVGAAPLFLWTAAHVGLVAAVVVLGAARAGASLAGYAIARRLYGVEFPWAFAARVAAAAAAMGLLLAALRAVWPTSLAEALSLTLLGALVFLGLLRAARVVGPEEAAILRRTTFPGRLWLLRLLAAEQ